VSHRLREASIHVVAEHSVVAPLIIDGLLERIEALGAAWERKREFHLTVLPRATIAALAAQREQRRGRAEPWDAVTRVLSGRTVGPITTHDDVRRVTRPDDDLRTLIVMVDAPGLVPIFRDLSAALDAALSPPPAHVTLYSSDPAQGIGIENDRQLAERAPPLTNAEQREVRDAIGFDTAFDDSEPDPPFTPAFVDAFEYAAAVHRGQRHRARDVPYTAHVLAVAELVAEDGGDEVEAIAALLHDTAEDHGGESRLADIERRFGPDVAAIVRALSDTLDPGEVQRRPWRARKDRYLASLRRETDARILRVSNADKLHNARTLLAEKRLHGAEMWERHAGGKQDELWYYGALAEIFAARRPTTSVLVHELAATLALLAAD
jgi:HD domain